jgi:hypothetical protein
MDHFNQFWKRVEIFFAAYFFDLPGFRVNNQVSRPLALPLEIT